MTPVWRNLALAATVVLTSACSTLPVVPADRPAVDPGDVKFKASSGRILSPERSRELVARLAGPGEATDLLARHLAVEQEVSGTPLSLGNRVVLLQDGPATYDAMFAAIAGARDHIHMETYILEDDAVGQRFAEALLERQRQGVRVRLVYDSVGSLGTKKEYFQRLRDGGVEVLEFNPVNPLASKAGWELNERDHRKLLIVDGRVAFLGGINISGVYSGSASGSGSFGGSSGGAPARAADDKGAPPLPWRDTDVQIEGPAVADLQTLFIDTWTRQKGPAMDPRAYFPPLAQQGREVVRALGSSPDEAYSQIYVTLISAMHSAEKEILITNAYFVPDPQLIEALVRAVARGVDVKIIVPSVTDSKLVFYAGRSHYDTLLRAGVQMHERRGALLHAKTLLIDGVWTTVGSTNLDWRSFLHNQELTAVILGQDFGLKMRDAFDRDLAASTPLTLETWRRRPVGDRFKEWFSRLWEYWL